LSPTPNRRPRGTGMVYAKDSIRMGKWYARGRPVKRSLGPVRQPGSREGLTKTMAEAKLRDLISASVKAPPPVAEGLTIKEVGTRLIKQLRAKNRKTSTLENYESYLRVHLAPYFGETPISEITADDVEDFIEACMTEHSIKSTKNYLGLLHGIFDFAIRKRWAYENPCRLAEKPEAYEIDRDIRFLDQAELQALLEATGVRYRHNPETLQRAARVRALRDGQKLPWKQIAARLGVAESTAIYLYRCEADAVTESDADLRRVERAMYLTAAMTGLRQGELFPLRWMDIDWLALRARPVRDAEVQALDTGGPTRRPRRPRARAAVPGLGVHRGGGPGLRASPHRRSARPLAGLEALQVRAKASRGPRSQVSRSPPHLWNPVRRERGRDADAAGMDGASRHQDDADLRRLRTRRQ
jgi:integrase